jgi:hypothetical protein
MRPWCWLGPTANSRRRVGRLDGGHHEQHRSLAGQLSAYARRPVPTARSRGELVELDVELERVSWDHLTAEASLVDPAEQRNLPGVANVGQEGDPAELSECLYHQHPWQGRPTWEVAGEEGLLACQVPQPPRRPGCHDLGDLIDEKERGAVGEDIGRSGKPRAVSAHAVSVPCRVRRLQG